jgi:SpoVK/Ycf46/Vps4 family AAA+-type ATPase
MKTQKIESLNQDLIRGKGKGLIILLHGVPGVGKTATAEAVAIENRKPLFAITCGDVGTDVYKIDHNLGKIFRLAHKWDCVLLFDEADVFLTQRSKLDIKRNAMVSGMFYLERIMATDKTSNLTSPIPYPLQSSSEPWSITAAFCSSPPTE